MIRNLKQRVCYKKTFAKSNPRKNIIKHINNIKINMPITPKRVRQPKLVRQIDHGIFFCDARVIGRPSPAISHLLVKHHINICCKSLVVVSCCNDKRSFTVFRNWHHCPTIDFDGQIHKISS